MTRLPEEFENRMKEMLGEEYDDFLSSYEENKRVGIRVNNLKISPDSFLNVFPFELKKVNWCNTGFMAFDDEKYGRSPLHDAGAFYMQEPSAMAVVSALESVKDIKGLKVLDLCAAPGGKSTRLAALMQGEGLLVSNEINKDRANILSSNIERMGVRNCIVINETPDRIADAFEGFFDVIVVDAPCSGEGMFRKDETAVKEWSPDNVKMCAKRQEDILNEAVKALKDDGILVYSTCTFAPEEDEAQIADFLNKNPEFDTVEVPVFKEFEKGRPEWVKEFDVSDKSDSLKRCARLFPHKIDGEGHFICILKRGGEESEEENSKKKKKRNEKRPDRKSYEIFDTFCKENIIDFNIDKENIVVIRESLWAVPEFYEDKNLHTLRAGLWLGDIKKERFEPSHSFAMALTPKEAKRFVNLSEEDSVKYRHGEELRLDVETGWTLICFEGVSLGWGKSVNGVIKNHYPKGLRIQG